jgi:hypothetical protein
LPLAERRARAALDQFKRDVRPDVDLDRLAQDWSDFARIAVPDRELVQTFARRLVDRGMTYGEPDVFAAVQRFEESTEPSEADLQATRAVRHGVAGSGF